MTENCQHSWIAPDWLRDHGDNRKDLPMICEKCHLWSCLRGIEHSIIQDLVFLFGITINNAKYEIQIGGRLK